MGIPISEVSASLNSSNCQQTADVTSHVPFRKGYANVFTYECGLKRSTGQAYVHVTEERNEDNVSFMGLILTKYIPNVASLRQDSWQGIFTMACHMIFQLTPCEPQHHAALACRCLSQ